MTENNSNIPEITIAFLNYNTPDDLIQALESVASAAEGIDYHVTVIDNCSTDDSVNKLKEYNSELDILTTENNLGFAAGFNKIFSHINTPYYFLLNSDIILSPGCIKKMLIIMNDNPRTGIAGVALVRENGSSQTSFGEFPSLASELINRSLWQKIYAKKITCHGSRVTDHDTINSMTCQELAAYNACPAYARVDCIIGAAMLLPRSTFEKIGGMDENFFFFLEETDWCKRIKEAGLEVLHIPDVKVTHLQGKTANNAPVKARIEFHRSRSYYFKKHHGIIAAAILLTGCFIRLIINFTAMLCLTILSLGKSIKFKNKMLLYGNVLLWYLHGCPNDKGLKN